MTYAFSDGDPLYELGVFLVLLGFFWLIARLPSIPGVTCQAMQRIARFVRQRRALPEMRLESDLLRLDATRIVVGGIAVWRYGEILLTGIQAGNMPAIVVSGSATLLAALVTIGLLTQFASLALMATANIIIDNYLGASTLGTMVLSMVLLIFVLAPAGRTFSVDAMIAGWRRRRGFQPGLIRKIGGEVSEDRLILSKLAGLLAYYCVCLYSISWHLNDDAWLSGNVVGWVLLSPASNPNYSDVAWRMYEFSPWLYVNFSRLSILGMAAWYVLVLPGLFMGRLVRYFVIGWGLCFFLISTFVLPLSYLGWYELCLWFLLFGAVPVRRDQTEPRAANEPGRLATGLIMTLLVLVLAYVVRLPINIEADRQAPGSWSKSVFASSPAAFGIYKINVFNTQDLAVFTFRSGMYLPDQHYDMYDERPAGSHLSGLPRSRFRFSDAQRYRIAAHSRRVAQANLGCDREYWDAVLPFYKQAILNPSGVPPIEDIVIERQITTWPTSSDFFSYTSPPRVSLLLCRAWLDFRNDRVKQHSFLQAGIDEGLRRRNYPLVLSNTTFEAALKYPCARDGQFLLSIASSRSALTADATLQTAAQSVAVGRAGRLEIDCLMEVHDLIQRWPQILSQPDTPDGSPVCEAGIRLLEALLVAAQAAGVDVVDVENELNAARNAFTNDDFGSCVSRIFAGRAHYWQAFLTRHAES